MHQLQIIARLIHTTDREAWTLDCFIDPKPLGDTLSQRRLARTDITDELNHLATLQGIPQTLTKLFHCLFAIYRHHSTYSVSRNHYHIVCQNH